MSLIKLLLAISFQVNLFKTVDKCSRQCVKAVERNLRTKNGNKGIKVLLILCLPVWPGNRK